MSNPTASLTALDFKQAVALQFASRPTLRQVASSKILALLKEHYPSLATIKPSLNDADALQLMVPKATGNWTQQSLVQVVLQAVQDGNALNLEHVGDLHYSVYFPQPYRFPGSDGYDYIALNGITDAVNELVRSLPYDFQQAQVDYWQSESNAGVSHDNWLQLTLKMALLRNLPLQGLDSNQQDCIHGLLKGGSGSPGVFAVKVKLEADGESFEQVLPNLLVTGEWDEGTVVLWCAPSSVVRSFDSLDDFALALKDELAERYRFDSITWSRYELEGDVFSQQTALMLDAMLDSIERLRTSYLNGTAQLEQAYAVLSDPSQWFIESYIATSDARVAPAPGLRKATPGDSFAYQCGLFELALAQAESKGIAYLEGVQDLHSFASQRLREQLLADHPDDANYFPDDLNLTLTVARGIPGGMGAGVGGGVVETRTMTLTQFAIGNLSSLQGATVTAIEHRGGQLIMDWMTVDYVRALVEQVDIGGHYPDYVKQQLDDPDRREQRVRCFAREWRCSLLFSALAAKLDGTLSEAALQCVADYCRGDVSAQARESVLMPLAFKREPTASEHDVVRGMYVIYSTQPPAVLLYRPLYVHAPLKAFASMAALMAAIAEAGDLQDSVLEWLTPQARRVYEFGGFVEPHLLQPIIDTSLLPEKVAPASLGTKFWLLEVDTKLYMANRDLLVELAERQSVSTAESRWAILVQGAWLLFDVVTLLLRGPVATVAWLVQAMAGLKNDVSALTQGSAFERSAAVVDLTLNLGMALLHAHLPKLEVPVLDPLPDTFGLDGPALQGPGFEAVDSAPVQGVIGVPGGIGKLSALQLDFTWRGRQGFNALAPQQRKALLAMRSDVVLVGLDPLDSGAARGLYQIKDRYYAVLVGDAYAVELIDDGVQVVDEQGGRGPWLSFEQGVWRVDGALHLRGGMPKSRRQIQEEANRLQFEQDKEQEAALATKHNELAVKLNRLVDFQALKEQQIETLKREADPDGLHAEELSGLINLRKLTNIKVINARKLLVENSLTHDKVLAAIAKSNQLEPKFVQGTTEAWGDARQTLIANITILYNELTAIIKEEDVATLAEMIAERPESEAEIEQYKAYLKTLDKVVGWELERGELSGKLDVLLEESLKDNSIVFKDETGVRTNKDKEMAKIVASRRETAIDMEINLLFLRAELSLNRLARVDASVLEQYHDYLAGKNIKSACASHGDLAGNNLSLVEQIDVLNDVIEPYDETLVLVDYLSAVGGPAINSDKLQLFKATLTGLKAAAESELSQAVREKELEVPRISRPSLYAARGGKRRLVRTHQGRSILAEELEVEGESVVQQREPHTGEVLKRFHLQGSDWVEKDAVADAGPPPSPRPPEIGRKRSRALMGEVDAVIKLAHTYSPDEPIGLSAVIEGHSERLKKALASLPRSAPDDELIEELDGSIRRLSNARRDMLKTLHLNTRYPTGNSLRFLNQEKQITIALTQRRIELSSTDYLDVYQVRRLPEAGEKEGDGLWEAHFHYPSAETPARQFSKGHLKVWWQRKLGREAQLRAAGTGKDLLEIYRGELRLPDVEGIIPFD